MEVSDQFHALDTSPSEKETVYRLVKKLGEQQSQFMH
jgi:hypothetical protein